MSLPSPLVSSLQNKATFPFYQHLSLQCWIVSSEQLGLSLVTASVSYVLTWALSWKSPQGTQPVVAGPTLFSLCSFPEELLQYPPTSLSHFPPGFLWYEAEKQRFEKMSGPEGKEQKLTGHSSKRT